MEARGVLAPAIAPDVCRRRGELFELGDRYGFGAYRQGLTIVHF